MFHWNGIYIYNTNTVYSKFSTEISAKTLPLIAKTRQSLSSVMNDTNINIDITGNGVDFYQYKLNQDPWSEDVPIKTPIILNSLEDGPYTLMIIGKNTIGSVQDPPSVYTWSVDTHVDNFSCDQSDCLWALDPKIINLSGTREAQSTISLRTSFTSDISISYPDMHLWKAQLSNMLTENYTVLVQAADIAGNKDSIEKSIHVLPESALIETQTDSLLADNTQTLSLIVSFFTKDQEQICIDPTVYIESTMGDILEESCFISNNQLICLLKADSNTGTARISAVFEHKKLGSKDIEMIPGPFDRIGFHCSDPTQEVGMEGDFITLQLEDAFGHPVSVPYDLDIKVNSTALSDGEFLIKQNDVWDWKAGMFVKVIKANVNSFMLAFRTSIPGNHTLNAIALRHMEKNNYPREKTIVKRSF